MECYEHSRESIYGPGVYLGWCRHDFSAVARVWVVPSGEMMMKRGCDQRRDTLSRVPIKGLLSGTRDNV